MLYREIINYLPCILVDHPPSINIATHKNADTTVCVFSIMQNLICVIENILLKNLITKI